MCGKFWQSVILGRISEEDDGSVRWQLKRFLWRSSVIFTTGIVLFLIFLLIEIVCYLLGIKLV
jgi:uncharacterized protein HemY